MSSPDTAKRQLEQLIQAGRLAEACALGAQLVASEPRDADAWYLKGQAEAQANAVDAAVESFRRVIVLAPNDAVTHYNLGRLYRMQERYADAIASYREALRVQPALPEAHNNLADTLRETGEAREAERHYREALRLRPAFVEAWYGLGILLEAAPDLAGAAEAYRQAVRLRPGFAEAHYNLGNVLKAQGALNEARAAYQSALDAKADFAEACNNLGLLQRELREYQAAVDSHQRAIALQPERAEFHVNLGNAYGGLTQYPAAVSAYHRALELNPQIVPAWIGLADALRWMEQYDGARESLDRARELSPEDPSVYMALGTLDMTQGRYIEAMAHYDHALELKPDAPEMHFNRGIVLQELGRFDEARIAYQRALALKPSYCEAYRQMVWFRRYKTHDADVAAMERLWTAGEVDDECRMHLGFALGKVSEDLKDYDKAFDYFLTGARLKRASFRYAVSDDETLFKRLQAVFGAEFFAARRDWGDPDPTPILIVGMPRSGTTLAEQILATHPQVAGAGELMDLKRVLDATVPGLRADNFPEGAQALDDEACRQLGAAYCARLRARVGTEAAYITDKMPANFQFVGMLRAILPRARVIHCRRNALDTCWSIFKNYFAGSQPFAYSLEELGRYYRAYEDLMAHWARVLPGWVLDFDYEALIDDQDGATRRLLEFCGLEWDERCLHFHETDRAVKTASLAQVRKPVYRSSVGVWRRYERQLAPLVEILGEREA